MTRDEQIRSLLAEYLDKEKSPSIDPTSISLYSLERASFKCPECGYTWESKVGSFTCRCLEYACAQCAGRRLVRHGRIRGVLEAAPEMVRWLDPDFEQDLSNVSISSKEPLHFRCIYCGEPFKCSSSSFRLVRNMHTKGECITKLGNKLQSLLDSAESDFRLKVLRISLTPDFPVFLEDLRKRLSERLYKIFIGVHVDRVTYKSVGESLGVTRSYVGQGIKRADAVAENLIKERNYKIYDFGQDPSKYKEECEILKNAYRYLKPRHKWEEGRERKKKRRRPVSYAKKYVTDYPDLMKKWDFVKNNEDPAKVFVPGNPLKYHWTDGSYTTPARALRVKK